MKNLSDYLKASLCTTAFSTALLAPIGAQANDNSVVVRGTGMSVAEAIEQIEKSTDYTFFYKESDLSSISSNDIDLNGNIYEVLAAMFDGNGIDYVVKGNEIILRRTPEEKSNASMQQAGEQITVNGVVTDNMGPVIGATVAVKDNASLGTITDLDGRFSLSVPKGSTLVISFIGFTTQEVKVTGTSVRVKLVEDSKTLDEVVVVGFGTQKKANLTGSLTTVDMEELTANRPLSTVSDALQGAVPGLVVSSGGNAAGTSKSFQLRGAYSIGIQNSDGSYGNTVAPLVLIDNVEGSMDFLNPEDIETITVLKDAASTAIYGARAAGGVILITTKRPKGETKFTLNYNNNFAFGKAMNLPRQAPLMDYLNAYQDAGFGDAYWAFGSPSVSLWKEYLTQYRQDPSAFNIQGDGMYRDDAGNIYYLHEHDLYKAFMETSFQQTHNVSASGGTDKLRYRLSGSYLSSDGVLKTDKYSYTRLNFSSFISADVTKWFTQEATVSYNKNKTSSPQGNLYNTGLISYHPEGDMPAELSGFETDVPFNTPLNMLLNSNATKRSYDNPRIFLRSILKPFKGFEAVFEYTFDKRAYNYYYYTGKWQMTDIQGADKYNVTNDYLQEEKMYRDYNAFNIYGTYSFDIAKDHHFKLMAGFNQEFIHQENLYAISYDQTVIEVPALGSGTGTLQATDGYDETAVRGGFFRVNYNYMDKYLLEVNGRYDGSSKFPKTNRFGFFPSVSAGWNVAQEKFMEGTRHWLDMFKIRGSYGVIGNQNVANYSFYPTMSVSNTYNGWVVNGDRVTAITGLPALVSNSFTWEKVATGDIGFDLNLFNNRFTATFDWYQKNTTGMLAPGMQLPAVVGASAPMQNTADMRTRGWELAMNWRDRIGDWGYRIGFNLSDSKSVITKYDDNAATKLLSDYYPGMELGEIWGYEVEGFYTVDDFDDPAAGTLKEGITSVEGVTVKPGDLKLRNLRDDEGSTNMIDTGENTLDNPGDRKRIGNNLPRYLYGITLGANYKGFDLNIVMQGTGKRDYWIANSLTFPMYIYSANDMKYQPLYEGLSDYWKPVDLAGGDYTAVNPDAKFPRIYGGYENSGYNYGRYTDRYLSDASYFRIKNITLSYTVPRQWISKLALEQLRAFISIENVATFDHLPSGIDPETLGWSYPAFRTVSFGINFTL